MKRFLQRDFRDTHPNMGKALLFGLLAFVVAVAITGAFAHAADKGGPKAAPTIIDEIVPKATTWSGCGMAARAGWTIASIDFSPVTMASEGGKAGAEAFCDWQAGQYFLVGAFIRYDWAFGDLHTIGVNTDLSLGARVGMPLNKTVMPYIGAAWSRVDVEGLGNVDGWKALAGLEVRLATELPAYFAVEASRGFYKDIAGSGMDANATDIMASIKVRPFSK